MVQETNLDSHRMQLGVSFSDRYGMEECWTQTPRNTMEDQGTQTPRKDVSFHLEPNAQQHPLSLLPLESDPHLPRSGLMEMHATHGKSLTKDTRRRSDIVKQSLHQPSTPPSRVSSLTRAKRSAEKDATGVPTSNTKTPSGLSEKTRSPTAAPSQLQKRAPSSDSWKPKQKPTSPSSSTPTLRHMVKPREVPPQWSASQKAHKISTSAKCVVPPLVLPSSDMVSLPPDTHPTSDVPSISPSTAALDPNSSIMVANAIAAVMIALSPKSALSSPMSPTPNGTTTTSAVPLTPPAATTPRRTTAIITKSHSSSRAPTKRNSSRIEDKTKHNRIRTSVDLCTHDDSKHSGYSDSAALRVGGRCGTPPLGALLGISLIEPSQSARPTPPIPEMENSVRISSLLHPLQIDRLNTQLPVRSVTPSKIRVSQNDHLAVSSARARSCPRDSTPPPSAYSGVFGFGTMGYRPPVRPRTRSTASGHKPLIKTVDIHSHKA